MNEGYLGPEQFLFSTTIGFLTSLLLAVALRPKETQGRYPMEVREIIGYSQDELPSALDLMESSIEMGQKARVTICTQALPTEVDLADIYLGMLATGCHVTYPTARVIEGIPTTEFVLQKGSPAWPLLIPLIVPVLTLGLIAFGIAKIEAIGKVLVPLILVTVGGLIILAVVLRKPAEKYIERGGKIPRLASTSKKALAAR